VGWVSERSVGKRTIMVGWSRTGSYKRHLDRGVNPGESFRLSSRHMRLVLRRRSPETSVQPTAAALPASHPPDRRS
jgi:hypothetical protein